MMGLFGGSKKGLFGAPMLSDPAITAGSASSSPAAATLAPSTATPFKGKRNFLDKLGLVADAFGNNHNNADQLAERDKFEYQQQVFQQKNFAPQQVGDSIVRLNPQTGQYESLYTAPQKPHADDAFTQTLRNAGIDPTSPQARQLYMQRAQTLASPAPNFVSDGAGGGRWVQPPAPGMGGMSAPQAPVGKLTPLSGGGAPRGGARTFPIR